MTLQATILPTEEFDRGTTTAPPNIRARMAEIRGNAAAHGLDIEHLSRQVNTASSQQAPGILDALHAAAALLFLQWKSAQQTEETQTTLALARLFNGLTYGARELNSQFALVEDEHLDDLARTLKAGVKKEIDPAYLARALQIAANAHTHERAWLWVVLPTFARQPYGRILLRKVDIDHCANPIIVTQPFFLAGKSTLFHTHGLNWAISRPLGEGEVRNTHINTLWVPRSPKEPFPLIQIDMAEYWNQDVVGIPPKVIHGISKKREGIESIPALSEILADQQLKQQLISQTRFGELACMHIYCPDPTLSQVLADSPIVQADPQFFIENDMIVFDHIREEIWSGGGGSWPKRMVEFGTTGEHCGICYEDDPRRENLDPAAIWKWLIKTPPPQILRLN